MDEAYFEPSALRASHAKGLFHYHNYWLRIITHMEYLYCNELEDNTYCVWDSCSVDGYKALLPRLARLWCAPGLAMNAIERRSDKLDTHPGNQK